MVELLIDKSFTVMEVVGRLQQAKRTPLVTKLYLSRLELDNNKQQNEKTKKCSSADDHGYDDDFNNNNNNNDDDDDNEKEDSDEIIHAMVDLFRSSSSSSSSSSSLSRKNNGNETNGAGGGRRIWEMIRFTGCCAGGRPIDPSIMEAISHCQVKEIQYCDDHDDDYNNYTIMNTTDQLLRRRIANTTNSNDSGTDSSSACASHHPQTLAETVTNNLLSCGLSMSNLMNDMNDTIHNQFGDPNDDDDKIGCSLVRTKKGTLDWILSHPTISKVSLGNLIITNEKAIDIAKNLVAVEHYRNSFSARQQHRLLRSFTLFGSVFLDSTALSTVAYGLRYSPYLQTIELSDCSLQDEQIEELVEAILGQGQQQQQQQQQQKQEEDSNCGHPIVVQLPTMLSQLQKFHLQGNYCHSQGLAALSKLLSNPYHSQLIDLDISDQLDANEYNRGIRLDVSSTFLPVLLRGGPNHTTLKKLGIRECNLGDEELHGIVQVLCTNSTLEYLDIRYNRITPMGIQTIFASNLQRMKGLKHVLLRQGRGYLQDTVRDALYNGLQHNTCVLQSMDLFEWVDCIQYRLDLNKSGGKQLLLLQHQQNKVLTPNYVWPILLGRISTMIDGGGSDGGKSNEYHERSISNNSSTSSTTNQYQHHYYYSHHTMKRGIRKMRKDTMRKASVMYYFLRYGPVLMER